MKTIKFSSILFILYSVIAFSAISLKYPDLSNSKQAIKERHNELVAQLKKAEKNGDEAVTGAIVVKLGMFYQVHDLGEEALHAYNKALELSPYNTKLLYLLGRLNTSQGDFESAKQNLKKSIKYNEKYLPAIISLANVYNQEGDFKQAQYYFELALKLNEKSSEALVGLGKIFAQNGKYHEAIKKYKEAIQAQPIANQINFLISQAYAAIGDMKKAKEYNLKKGKTKPYTYDPIFNEVYSESRSASYYNQRAVMMYMEKDYVNAEKTAKIAHNLDKDSLYPILTLANIYVSTGKAKKAVELLEPKVNQFPDNDGLLYSLGVIEEILANDEKAIKWYKKALKLNPKMQQALTTLPSALMRLKRYDEALEQLDRAVKLTPENALLIYRQASILAYKNKCKQASSKAYDAVKKQPKNFALLSNFVKIAVHCDVSKQMQTDALNAARNMYQISQDDIVIELLAMIESKTGNKQNAIDYQAQLIFNQLRKKDTKHLEKYKKNLELYKKGKYPCCLFTAGDVDLSPPRIQKIR